MMVVGHIDMIYVTHSLHEGLILCEIKGSYSYLVA